MLTQDQDRRTTKLRGNVLVVDDCADSRVVAARVLRYMGLVVETSENGAEACQRTLDSISGNRPFDLIITDLHMPVMDGYAATALLRSRGYRGRIAALSADVTDESRQKCRAAGCDDLAIKPITFEKLYDIALRNLQMSADHLVKSIPAPPCASKLPSHRAGRATFSTSLIT